MLGKKSCRGCQYRTVTRDRCLHPGVSGLDVESIIEVRSRSRNVDVDREIRNASKRIQNAIALDQYATYIQSKYKGIETYIDGKQIMSVVGEGLLLQLYQKRLISGFAVLANMLSVRRWAMFKSLSGLKAGELHDVAELNLSALILLNQQVPAFRV